MDDLILEALLEHDSDGTAEPAGLAEAVGERLLGIHYAINESALADYLRSLGDRTKITPRALADMISRRFHDLQTV